MSGYPVHPASINNNNHTVQFNPEYTNPAAVQPNINQNNRNNKDQLISKVKDYICTNTDRILIGTLISCIGIGIYVLSSQSNTPSTDSTKYDLKTHINKY